MGMIKIVPPEEMKKLYNTPVNRKIRYWIYGVAGVVLVLLFSMIILLTCMEEVPVKAFLLIRGFAGLGAILFLILTAVFIYRINSEYILRPLPTKNKSEEDAV